MNTQAPVTTMWQRHQVRGDIQGLRAVAVLLVLIFHVWPDLLPGGYVGVDVFFVISGYLIVGSLVKELERTGKISLLGFYRRRARRLMPAALVVLGVVLAATILWLPGGLWEDTLLQVMASSLYVQNWYLSWASVDYLAAENVASPVLHYWSLSIEEQFYILWPLAMLLVAWVLRRFGGQPRTVVGVVLTGVFIASFGASLAVTSTSPEQAYFFSHTRFWEIALGGLIAVWLPEIRAGNAARMALFSVGLALILASAITYGAVPFPGWRALLPTAGAALIIIAGSFNVSDFRGIDFQPLRYVGDISYSLYLWHWPIVVFYTVWRPEIGLVDGLAVLLLAFLASHWSYHHIEERFRHRETSISLGPLSAGLSGAVLVAGIALLLYSGIMATATVDQPSASSIDRNYPGPAALMDGIPVPEGVPVRPAAAHLLRDRSEVYGSGCHQDPHSAEVSSCELGDNDGSFHVAVVGSSHSVNWLPSVEILAHKNGWRLTSLTKSGCSFASTKPSSCNLWQDNVAEFLEKNPVDLIILGENAGRTNSRKAQELIARRLARLAGTGAAVIAIRPTPRLNRAPASCLPDRIEACVRERADAESANTLALAAEQVEGVHLIDMNDAICSDEACGPVVGNLAVFRDKHHLTATYSRALAPYLEQRMVERLDAYLPVREGHYQTVSATTVAATDVGPRHGDAKLQCGPHNARSTSFERRYPLKVNAGALTMRRGDWAKEENSFEIWSGSVDREVVQIAGRYREGPGGIKTVEMTGTLRDGELIASGSRGPRTCSLYWRLPDASP